MSRPKIYQSNEENNAREITIMTIYCGQADPAALAGMLTANSYDLWLMPVGAFIDSLYALMPKKIVEKNLDYSVYANTLLLFSGVYSGALFIALLPSQKYFAESVVGSESTQIVLQTAMTIGIIEGSIGVFSSPRLAGIAALACCSDTIVPSRISTANIVILNTVLATLARFVFDLPATAMFSTYLVGHIIASLWTLMRWKNSPVPWEKSAALQAGNTPSNNRREIKLSQSPDLIWDVPMSESPRKTGVHEELPSVSR